MADTISKFGERNAIKDIVAIFKRKEGILYDDDCAAIPQGKNYLLYCVDMINENIDYPSFAKPKDIGKVAVSNTLSDIAAMGGWPTLIAACWGIPRDYPYKSIIEMNKGIEDVCRKYGAFVITGDLNTTPELCISVTALGTVPKKQVLKQKGAKAGDVIAVIGNIGQCNAAVLYFKNKLKLKGRNLFEKDLIKIAPALEKGRFLAKSGCISSCVDLTDGLYWGLWLLCKANGIGARIIEKNLPLSKRAAQVQKALALDKESVVIQKDGDFQLLFTIKREKLGEFLKKARGKYFVNIIGEMTNGKGIKIEKMVGKTRKMRQAGFEHFSTKTMVYRNL